MPNKPTTLREKFRVNTAVYIQGVAQGLGYVDVTNIEDKIMGVFDEVLSTHSTELQEKIFSLETNESNPYYKMGYKQAKTEALSIALDDLTNKLQ